MKTSSVWVWRLGALARLAVGTTLLIAGALKLNTPDKFAETIANFRLLPAFGNQLLAVVLPWCEVTTGLLLLANVWSRAAGLVATLLFFSFGIAAGAALARGLDIECGCFGSAGGAKVGLITLAIEFAGLVGSLLCVFTARDLQGAEKLRTAP